MFSFFPSEQFLVSSQSSAQPQTQVQVWEGQGRETVNKPHLGLVIPTRQLELLQEALGLVEMRIRNLDIQELKDPSV